jgi:hypothetical protein
MPFFSSLQTSVKVKCKYGTKVGRASPDKKRKIKRSVSVLTVRVVLLFELHMV